MDLDLTLAMREKPSKIKEVPYKQTSQTDHSVHIRNYKQKQMENNFGNILRTDNSLSFEGTDVTTRMAFYLRRKTEKLCRGTVSHFSILFLKLQFQIISQFVSVLLFPDLFRI